MKSENKRVKGRTEYGVPYGFCFGSMSGADMRQYMPHTWSKSAQYMKLIQLLDGAPRSFFNDSACVSNLASNKAGLIERRKDGKMHLTSRGKYYLRTRKVEVDVDYFLLNDSYLRYVQDPIDQVIVKLFIGDKDYKGIAKVFARSKKEKRETAAVKNASRLLFMLRGDGDRSSCVYRLRKTRRSVLIKAVAYLKDFKGGYASLI